DVTSSSLRYDLRIAFFNLFVQQARIDLFEKVLKRYRQNEKLIGLKYEAGTEAKWNVMKTKAEAERAAFNLESAKAESESAREQLARLLHLESLPGKVAEAPDAGIYR